MEVGLFIPCFVDQLAPQVGIATLEVLERVGCRVVYEPRQTCCGQPFLNLGSVREAKRLARLHVERFAHFDAIVCPSASCVTTVRRHYAEIGVAADPLGVRLRGRTFELGEFLVRELGRTDVGARFAHRVALLPSCHGLRELGLGTPSESAVADPEPGITQRLLQEVRGLELVQPDRPDECCGFGGAFSVEFPELSGRMGRDRLRALAATGAEYVTATDSSCLLHLDGIRRRMGAGPQPLHLAEVLASSSAP